MDNKRSISSYFEGVFQNIDIILNNDFYSDKYNLNQVKDKVKKWYSSYNKTKSLKSINPEELKELELEITDFFAQYVATEPIEKNYSERLSYDFGELEEYWEKEMLGEKIDE